jgi:hypothetical protein
MKNNKVTTLTLTFFLSNLKKKKRKKKVDEIRESLKLKE